MLTKNTKESRQAKIAQTHHCASIKALKTATQAKAMPKTRQEKSKKASSAIKNKSEIPPKIIQALIFAAFLSLEIL